MQIVRIASLARLVVDREICHVYACARARYFIHSGARALKTFQGHFEQLALLRIHVSSFKIVDAEEVVIKLAYIFVDEVAAGHVRAATAIASLRMVETIDVVPLSWNRSLGRFLVDNKLPEIFRRVNIARKAASCDITLEHVLLHDIR